MSGRFAQEMTHVLSGYDLGRLDDPSLKTADITNDILRMPQMQAIKQVLLLHSATPESLRDMGLPDAVIEWVMS